MKPKPWSHSALDDFKNCPRAYHEKKVLKSVVEEKGPATLYGEQVHKHFEDRMRHGVVLPPDLETHEEYLSRLEALPGDAYIEHKIALDTRAQPCAYYGENVWFRGVIDYMKINGRHARMVDYKTGKPHQKVQQLNLFALWTFIAFPDVQAVHAEYYWTQLKSTWGPTIGRERLPWLWAGITPDLKQYAEAFVTDTWQPRPSGLCNGWCPVTGCEFWKPKRPKR